MSNLLNDTIMKKMMFTLIALLTMSAAANAMSYEQARNEALFLTDKMAYELNLTDAQYEAAYEINLDYLMSVTSVNDVYGVYWERRNLDLSYILYQWQWDAYLAANYFYRPLYWSAGHWHFGVYARYTTRDFFYFGRPDFFVTYRGGHAWHMNGGRSYYHGRIDQIRPALGNNRQHFGMRTRFDNGEFRHSGRSYGDNRGYRSGSSTRVTAGNNRRFGNSDNNDRRFGNSDNNDRRFGNSQGDNSNRRFGNSQSDGNRRFGNNSSQRQDLNSGSSNPSRNGVDVPSGGFGGNRSTNNRPSASSFNNNGSSRSNIEPSSNNRPSASSFNNNSNRSNIESSGSSRPNVSSFNNSNSNRSSNSIRPNIGSSSSSYSSGSSSRSTIGSSSSRRSSISSSSSSRPNFGTSSSGSSSSNRSSSTRSSSSSSRSHFGGSRR